MLTPLRTPSQLLTDRIKRLESLPARVTTTTGSCQQLGQWICIFCFTCFVGAVVERQSFPGRWRLRDWRLRSFWKTWKALRQKDLSKIWKGKVAKCARCCGMRKQKPVRKAQKAKTKREGEKQSATASSHCHVFHDSILNWQRKAGFVGVLSFFWKVL